MHQCALQLSFLMVAGRVCGPVSIKHGLQTTDYGLGIKHGLKYKTQTEV